MARGMICIYRMLEAAVTGPDKDVYTEAHEDGAAAGVEKIELGPGAGPPNGAAAPAGYEATAPVLRKFTCGPERREVENPAPLLDESRRPDISYGGAEYNITVNFPVGSSRYQDRSATLAQLLKWDQEPSTIKKLFPLGRYGIRNDAFPYQDCEPTATSGYLLSMVKADWDLAFDSIVPVTIVMRHAGAADRLNTGAYRTSADADAPAYARGADGVRP